ncbi:MAG: 50S ribosomal protein L25/general stress protein Ctc, partial [Bacteroidales bacterium]|nr:50S ribosomal protein L25/general stress protein Ctc [Bacteroidales bacterium]
MVDFSLNAKSRDDAGKGASRRLRRLADEVPAIVYGGASEPQMIALTHKDITHALENEAFYSHIIKLNIDGKGQDVILKDVQRHPAKPRILHLDFLRVDKNQKLHTRVPLHIVNGETAQGVKLGGGIVTQLLNELEILCLPKDLPEFIEVDMASVELGQILHISDLKLP